MASRYSVVQYLPNPLAGERINIGIIVFGEGQFISHFLENWARVECFADGSDIQFLKDFATGLNDVHPEQLGLSVQEGFATLTEKDFARLTHQWSNSIQFTPPRGSLLRPEALLADLLPLFLRVMPRDVAQRRIVPRKRQTAARIAVEGLQYALRETGVDAEIRRHAMLRGRVERHMFDAFAENGVPFIATHGLSFEISDESELSRNVDALGLAVRDVKDANPEINLGIVALRNRAQEEREPFLRALHIFGAYGARVLKEDEVRVWAEASIRSYADEHGVELPGETSSQNRRVD